MLVARPKESSSRDSCSHVVFTLVRQQSIVCAHCVLHTTMVVAMLCTRIARCALRQWRPSVPVHVTPRHAAPMHVLSYASMTCVWSGACRMTCVYTRQVGVCVLNVSMSPVTDCTPTDLVGSSAR